MLGNMIAKNIFASFLCLALISCTTDNTLEWHEEVGYKWSNLNVPFWGETGFKLQDSSKTGIVFSNDLEKAVIEKNRILLNGSGVAVGDVDGDGLADIYFSRLDGPNALYKNLGDWRFEDVAQSAGVTCEDQNSSGAVFADVDGDFDLDLLVTAVGGPNALFLNDGSGKFTDVTEAYGFSAKTGASTMALADVDGDADLDVYIANYKKKSAKDIWDAGELVFEFIVDEVDGEYSIQPRFREHFVLDIRGEWVLFQETGEPDQLLLNDGTGKFEKVDMTGGAFLDEAGEKMETLKDWGLMARFQDMDGDGDPDIYVCNDFESPDRIWINDGTGRFQAIPKLAIRNISNSSMAIDFSDIDRDGDQDFLVVDMLSRNHQFRMTQKSTAVPLPHMPGEIDNRPQHMRNTLFLNNGDKTYSEIAQYSGIDASEWSWSNLFFDIDLDGYEDVIIATGHYYDAQDFDAQELGRERIGFTASAIQYSETAPPSNNRLNTIFLHPELKLPNAAFRNRGNLTFEDVSQSWGLSTPDISNGMALGDLDNDGDLDVVMNRLNAKAAIYRNETAEDRIAIRLRGKAPNTQGIGAKIRLLGDGKIQMKEIIAGGAYLSSSDPMAVFAATGGKDFSIEVTWRNGMVSTVENVQPNRIYEIDESSARVVEAAKQLQPKPFFEDVSHLLDHKHYEGPFDDFVRQPLMPVRHSRLGPGVSWHDWDGDGDDDLLISNGRDGAVAAFKNENGAFRKEERLVNGAVTEYEKTGVLAWTGADNSASLLVSHSNFESISREASFIEQMPADEQRAGSQGSKITAGAAGVGPLAMADYDGDGDLDLFVGGRSIPGRYGVPAPSFLYKNEKGVFQKDDLNSEKLAQFGMVSGAVFSDFDSDGDPDLILAVEWGAVNIFRNTNGAFENVTEALGLSQYLGWWNGVTTGDLDEDGKLDIIATNWGLNNKYAGKITAENPLRLFYYDFDRNGVIDIIESYFVPELQAYMPFRNLNTMMRAIPMTRMRMPSHKKYSRSTVQEIAGPRLKSDAGSLATNTLAHMVFFNRGEKFEAVELPLEAQLTPAFHAGIADFDGDGHDDVFLSQNFFSYPEATSRSDAGRGLWLRGDGKGGLQAVHAQESGVEAYGEQRAAALSDYDGDGRVDLVVSQNAAETMLFKNVGAKPGLRVRLQGASENPHGVGAVVRVKYENGDGPVREIQAGSGYWSQSSAVQVFGVREGVKNVQVRWPSGETIESEIPAGAREIIVKRDGEVTKVK